jgi:FixJ family two-component response regulator
MIPENRPKVNGSFPRRSYHHGGMYGDLHSVIDYVAGWAPFSMTGDENATGTVYVVDDDADVRRALERLMRSVGLKFRTFASAADFLAANLERPACLVLDVRMPGIDGFALQKRIAGTEEDLPVIFITGEDDEEGRMRALQDGAIAFFYKPFDEGALLDAIDRGIRLDS